MTARYYRFNRLFIRISTSIIFISRRIRAIISCVPCSPKISILRRRRANWIMRNFAWLINGGTRVHIEFVHEDTNTFFYFSRPPWAKFARGLRSARRYRGWNSNYKICMRQIHIYIYIYITVQSEGPKRRCA